MFGTVYLGSYGTFKSYLDSTEYIASKEVRNFIAGGSAGSFAWLTLLPIDFIKTSYQTGRGKEFVIQQVKTNGIRTLWKGGVPTISRIFPINACAMMSYEYAKAIIDNKN